MMMTMKQTSGNSATNGAITPSHLKKQLRDVTRMLNRPNLPSTIRCEQERKQQHILALLKQRDQQEKESKIKSRYAKVRFFENTKSSRRVKQASRALVENASEETLAKWIEAKTMQIYTLNFPIDRKYISMFPTVHLSDTKVLSQRTQICDDLVKQHGFDTKMTLDEGVAMAKVELTVEPKKQDVKTVVKGVQALKRTVESDDDDDSDDFDSDEDEDDDSDDDDEDSEDENAGSDDDDNDDVDDSDDDSQVNGDEDSDDDDSMDNDSVDDERNGGDDDEDSDDDDSDDDDSDDDDSDDDDSDDDEDDDSDEEEEEENPGKRKRNA